MGWGGRGAQRPVHPTRTPATSFLIPPQLLDENIPPGGLAALAHPIPPQLLDENITPGGLAALARPSHSSPASCSTRTLVVVVFSLGRLAALAHPIPSPHFGVGWARCARPPPLSLALRCASLVRQVELEEATLVVQITTILAVARAGKFPDIRVHPALHEAILDLASRMFVLNARCQAPFVCSVEDYRRGGKADARAEKASKTLFELRSALSAYIRTAIDGLLVDANSLMLLLQSGLYQACMFDLPHVVSAGGVGLPALLRYAEHVLASMFTVLTRVRGGKGMDMDVDMDMDGIRRGCAAPLAALEGMMADRERDASAGGESMELLIRKVKGVMFA